MDPVGALTRLGGIAAARALLAMTSHRALHHGWEVRLPPERPQIGVPRGRPVVELRSAEVRRIDAAHDGWATTPLLTVLTYADGRAANPFESALRAILIEEGWAVLPQHEVRARGLVLPPRPRRPVRRVRLRGRVVGVAREGSGGVRA